MPAAQHFHAPSHSNIACGETRLHGTVLNMQKIPLGTSSLLSSRLAYGCWRLAGPKDLPKMTPEDEAHGRKAAITAYEAGYTLFYNAGNYATRHAERILGDAIKQ